MPDLVGREPDGEEGEEAEVEPQPHQLRHAAGLAMGRKVIFLRGALR
jgi:hypothetical protein